MANQKVMGKVERVRGNDEIRMTNDEIRNKSDRLKELRPLFHPVKWRRLNEKSRSCHSSKVGLCFVPTLLSSNRAWRTEFKVSLDWENRHEADITTAAGHQAGGNGNGGVIEDPEHHREDEKHGRVADDVEEQDEGEAAEKIDARQKDWPVHAVGEIPGDHHAKHVEGGQL